MLKKNLVEPCHINCDAIAVALAECERNARLIYGNVVVDKIGTLHFEFFDKGRDAAIAVYGRDVRTGGMMGIIQFSMHLTVHNITRMISEIVPHEYAHILCMANGWDNAHGADWVHVCKSLGGNGEAFHTFATIDGRLKNLYEATCDEGHSYWLTGKQVKIAAATGIEVRDATGRNFTLTKRNITGNMKKL